VKARLKIRTQFGSAQLCTLGRLHRRLEEAAAPRGCSARQLILPSIERLVAEKASERKSRVRLPLVQLRAGEYGRSATMKRSFH
jgi:hypothetical protein